MAGAAATAAKAVPSAAMKRTGGNREALRWLRSTLETVINPADPTKKQGGPQGVEGYKKRVARGSDGYVLGSFGEGGFDASRATGKRSFPSCHYPSALCRLDGGRSVLVSENHSLRRLHTHLALNEAAEQYAALRKPLQRLTNELEEQVDEASAALATLDGAYEASREAQEGALRDVMGRLFEDQTVAAGRELCAATAAAVSSPDANGGGGGGGGGGGEVEEEKSEAGAGVLAAATAGAGAGATGAAAAAAAVGAAVPVALDGDALQLVLSSTCRPAIAHLPALMTTLFQASSSLDGNPSSGGGSAVAISASAKIRKALTDRVTMDGGWSRVLKHQESDCCGLLRLAAYDPYCPPFYSSSSSLSVPSQERSAAWLRPWLWAVVDEQVMVALLLQAGASNFSLSPFQPPLSAARPNAHATRHRRHRSSIGRGIFGRASA